MKQGVNHSDQKAYPFGELHDKESLFDIQLGAQQIAGVQIGKFIFWPQI